MKQEPRLLAIEARLCLVLSVIFIHGKVITPGLCHYGFTWSDKFEHLFAFFILSLLLDFAFPGKPFTYRKIAVLLLYGAGLEVIQLFVPFRDCDLFDFIADVLGIALYPFAIPLIKRMPLLKLRWDAEP